MYDHRLIEDLRRSVKSGAKILFEKFNGDTWMQRIDKERLDMLSEENSILGQLFAGYAAARGSLRLSRYDLPRYGFSVDHIDGVYNRAKYANDLRETWCEFMDCWGKAKKGHNYEFNLYYDSV